MTLPESTPEYWIRQAQKEKAMCKIDEQVARKLGWEQRQPESVYPHGLERNGDFLLKSDTPAYSTSIEAAIECFGDREWKLERVMVHPADRATTRLFWCAIRTGFDTWVNSEADSAPLAIVKAFLALP